MGENVDGCFVNLQIAQIGDVIDNEDCLRMQQTLARRMGGVMADGI